MADEQLLRDIEFLVDTLRQMTTASDKSMNVAYADETALRPLKTILYGIAQNFQGFMAKETLKQQQEVAKVTEQVKKTEEAVKKETEARDRADNNALKSLGKLEKEAEKTTNNLALVTRIGQQLAGIIVDSVKQMGENAKKFATFAQGLTSAGVSIMDGGKGFRESLTDSANKIGMKTDEFVKMVSGNSQALARLSASGVNQMNYMTDAMAQYQTVAGASREDAAAVWDYMSERILKFDTDEQIRNRNMATESRILLEHFRDLSFATGKSVENLVKEEEARKKNYLMLMMEKNRPELMNKINAMQMPEAVREYALTGRQTPELMRLVGLNPEVGQLMSLFDRMRNDRSYDKISMEDYANMVNPIVDRIKANAQGFTQMGPYFANAFNETLMQGLDFGKVGIVTTKVANKEQLGFGDAMKAMEASVSNLSNEKLLAYSVSLDKFQKVTEALAGSAEKAAKALRWVHEEFGDWAAVTLNAGESAGKAATSYAANVIGSGVGSYIATKSGLVTKLTSPVLKNGAKLGLKVGAKAVPLAMAAEGVIDGVGAAMDIHELGLEGADAKYRAEAMQDSVFSNFIGLLNPMKMMYNAEALTTKTLDAITGKNESAKNSIKAELNTVNDAPTPNNEVGQSKPQPKTEEYLGSILGLLEKLTNEIESDAFYRKANQKLANNMTE